MPSNLCKEQPAAESEPLKKIDVDIMTHFADMRGRPEPIRMMYAMADTQFFDQKVTKDTWQLIKKEQPLGQLPVLQTAEGVLCQSNVIGRYVAKKLGLIGSSIWEESLHDLVVETCMELSSQVFSKIYTWKLSEKKPLPENSQQIIADVREYVLTRLNYIESVSEKQGCRYLVSDKMGLADAWLYTSLEFCKIAFNDIMEATPWVREFVFSFQSDDKMNQYLTDRPESAKGI